MNYDFPRPFGFWWKMYADKVKGDAHFLEFEQLFFDPCHGFMTWSLSPNGKVLTIHKVAGDGRYWKEKAYQMFELGKKQYGLKKMQTCTIRNPNAFARFFGGEIVAKEVSKHGQTVYWFEVKEVL